MGTTARFPRHDAPIPLSNPKSGHALRPFGGLGGDFLHENSMRYRLLAHECHGASPRRTDAESSEDSKQRVTSGNAAQLREVRRENTDVTVCTAAVAVAVAVADIILNDRKPATTLQSMVSPPPRAWVRRVLPEMDWKRRTRTHGSFGYGAAMRVSPVALLFREHPLEEALAMRDRVTEITHDHPEGIKGARAVTEAIWLALRGGASDKEPSFGCGRSTSPRSKPLSDLMLLRRQPLPDRVTEPSRSGSRGRTESARIATRADTLFAWVRAPSPRSAASWSPETPTCPHCSASSHSERG